MTIGHAQHTCSDSKIQGVSSSNEHLKLPTADFISAERNLANALMRIHFADRQRSVVVSAADEQRFFLIGIAALDGAPRKAALIRVFPADITFRRRYEYLQLVKLRRVIQNAVAIRVDGEEVTINISKDVI